MDIPTSSPPEEQETNWPETLRSFEVTDSVTSENSFIEIHKSCREKFESLIGIVVGYAKTQVPEIQSVLHVIAQDVDDQRVRFEIWTSDIDADEEHSLSYEALGDEPKRDFELVKNTLLTILSCLRDISKDVVEKLITFKTEPPQVVISTLAHFAENITKLGSLIKTLFDLVPPILAINSLRKQEGPYWAQRQKVLEVRNSAVRLDTQTTLVSSKPEDQTNMTIISRTQTPLVSSKQKSNAFAGTPPIKVSLASGIFEIEKENTSMGEIEDVVMSPGSDAQMNDPISGIEMFDYEFEVKEQDRWLPIANVSRIMQAAIPENAKIAKEAKECMQECVSEFVSFITSEALEKTQQEKRKTINGEDILFAMASLGFENYAKALQIYLSKYRESTISI